MTTPMFKPNGDGYDISAPGVLMVMASTLHDPEDSTPQGNAAALSMVKQILAAARAGGYLQTDILETLLIGTGEMSQRVRNMATEACNAAGDEAIGRIFAAMRNKKAKP